MSKKSNKKNPQTQKEQYNAVINSMDKQEPIESNNINLRAQSQDVLPSEFVEKKIMDSRDESINASTELPRFSEIERFSKVVAIDEAKLRRNDGMPKVAKTDKQ